MSEVEIVYFTDPACPASWAAEPARRRLERDLGGAAAVRLVMGGLAREIDRPLAVLRDWLDAAAGGMPVDPRLWLGDPPRSSYPACLAVVAAREQGLEAAYLRRAREGFALEGRKLDHAEALVSLARDVPGLDLARFRVDLASNAILELFGADLQRTRAPGPDAPMPRLEVSSPGRPATTLSGPDLLDPGAWSAAARDHARPAVGAPAPGTPLPPAVGAPPDPPGNPPGPPGRQAVDTRAHDAPSTPDPASDVLHALVRHGRLATPEVAELCDLPGPRAPAELWRLAAQWRVRAERHLTGETWKAA